MRQSRTFSKTDRLRSFARSAAYLVAKPLGLAKSTAVADGSRSFLGAGASTLGNFLPASPKKRLLLQVATLAVGTLVVNSLSLASVGFSANSLDYSQDYMGSYALPGDVLVADDAGYLVKINPQTNTSNRIGMTDYAVHTVESGETLSVIAERYGVSMSTIEWENNIVNANSLRVGQKLMVPPVDGVSYKIKSGDNLAKIASKYDISVDAILAQNALESEYVGVGQNIFLPGAEPIAPPVVTVSRTSSASRGASTTSYVNASPSTAAPTVGKVFIYPTRGSITQGYVAGHYALDIADRSKPPVWAAGGGTVVKASVGTWGGGYGNHVIIDHGNGLQTLYGHLDSVNVTVGQYVNQGDVIGIMGNTGRVYGVTGIHLHWEVRQDGVKQYPGNYY